MNDTSIHWNTLGIEPTADVGDIKRAYARRLKRVRPDEDPKGFQELRAAYEYALAMAESGAGAPVAVAAPVPQGSAMPREARDTGQPVRAAQAEEGLGYRDRHSHAVPVDGRRFPWHETLPDPSAAARAAWNSFFSACEPLLAAGRAAPGKPPKEEVAQACAHLARALRSAELEHLAARAEFHRVTVEYCARDDASPIVRVALLEGMQWEDERRSSGAFTTGLEGYAFHRALADRQYLFLLEKAQHSDAVTRLLEPGEPKIPWWKMYRQEFVSDMRKCLAHIRSEMPEVEHYRLGTERIEAWIDAVARPWPASTEIGVAVAVGLALMVFCLGMLRDGGLLPPASFFTTEAGAWVVAIPLFFVPTALTLAYPRYWHLPLRRLLARLRSNNRLHVGIWIAHVVLTTFAFGLNSLPPAFSELFFPVVGILVVLDLLLKPNVNPGHVMFLVMMAFLIGVPIREAFAPFAGAPAFMIPVMISGLFMTLRNIVAFKYGRDWYRARPRLLLLLAGGGLWALQYLTCQDRTFALAGAILGWWWILAVTAAADLLMLWTLNVKKTGGYLWFLALFAVFYAPLAIEIASPAAGMMHLQVSAGLALIFALMQEGAARLRKKSA